MATSEKKYFKSLGDIYKEQGEKSTDCHGSSQVSNVELAVSSAHCSWTDPSLKNQLPLWKDWCPNLLLTKSIIVNLLCDNI